jgi:Putative O-methyltransferase
MSGLIMPRKSYLKVPYDLRPAKQVERRMIFDGLLHLHRCGIPLKNYQYVGFGSIQFVDFILFHKFFGINKMISIEFDESIKKRVHFNSPYGCIGIKMKKADEVITTLSIDQKNILWLDYDDIIKKEMISDISLATGQLSVGSILLITVDTEPPYKDDSPKKTKSYFYEECEEYVSDLYTKEFSKKSIPNTCIKIFEKAIKQGLSGRNDISFELLFNFIYQDSNRMLTIGGMICSNTEKQNLDQIDGDEAYYFRRDFKDDPFKIEIPIITRKERLYLDQNMPCADDWAPEDFELTDDALKQYREIYRFLPAYAELFY